MSAKLKWHDQIVANIAAAAFPRVNAGKLVRSTIWTGAKIAFLIAASRQTEGLLDAGLYALALLLAFKFLFIGIAQRAVDERLARLDQLPAGYRDILTSKSYLFSKAVKR